jgi:hypothetical protein
MPSRAAGVRQMAEPVADWMACSAAAGLAASEDLVELLLHLLTNWAKSLRNWSRSGHPVRAARLYLLVHAVQGGLQFALERTAELLDQML